jgi:hypothetical protein
MYGPTDHWAGVWALNISDDYIFLGETRRLGRFFVFPIGLCG